MDKTLSGLGRLASGVLSRGTHGHKLSILIYHRVLPEPDPLLAGEPDRAAFRWQMELLARVFNVIPLPEAARGLRDGSLPPRAACVTFDDGYRDNAEVALPVLVEVGIPATFFVASGFLDGGRMWNDTVIESVRRFPQGNLDLTDLGLGSHQLGPLESRSKVLGMIIDGIKYQATTERRLTVEELARRTNQILPDDLMMSSDQVRDLRTVGMTVGAHTVQHPILARLPLPEARKEIVDGVADLERIVGHPVTCFAYPNGKSKQDYLPEHAKLVEELGFEAAVTTEWGISDNRTSPWELRRFTPWDRIPSRFLARLLMNLVKG